MKKKRSSAFSLSLTASPGAAADGLDTSTVTATLTEGGSYISGEVISLSAMSDTAYFTDTGSSQTVATTGALGTATAQLADTVAETVHLTALVVSSPRTQASADVTFGSGETALPPPVLREASGGNIDTAGLGSGVVHVDIPPWTSMTDGDVVMLSWRGTLAGGAAGPAFTPTHVVTLSESGSTLTITVDIPQYLTPYAGGGQLHLSYTVNDSPSEVADISVDGSAGTLNPPSVDEAEGTRLPSELTSVTLRVPAWPGMAERDLLYYYWLGNPAGGGDPLSDGLHIPAALVGQDITFTLDPAVAVVPFDGSTVEAWYQVTPAAGGAVQTARHATWQVGEAQALPAPVIEEAVDGVLDPEAAGESVHVRMAYPGMTDGDTLQVVWQGTAADGTPGAEYRPPLHVVTLGEAGAGYVTVSIATQAHVLPYTGGSLAVTYILTRVGGTAETSPAAEYQVGAQSTGLTIASVTSANGGDMLAHRPTSLFKDAKFTITATDDEADRFYDWRANSDDLQVFGNGLTATVTAAGISELAGRAEFEYIITATDVTRGRSAEYRFTVSHGLTRSATITTAPHTLTSDALLQSGYARLFSEWGDFGVYDSIFQGYPNCWIGQGDAGEYKWYVFNVRNGAVSAILTTVFNKAFYFTDTALKIAEE